MPRQLDSIRRQETKEERMKFSPIVFFKENFIKVHNIKHLISNEFSKNIHLGEDEYLYLKEVFHKV